MEKVAAEVTQSESNLNIHAQYKFNKISQTKRKERCTMILMITIIIIIIIPEGHFKTF